MHVGVAVGGLAEGVGPDGVEDRVESLGELLEAASAHEVGLERAYALP